MTTAFVETLNIFLILSKIVGIINICCTMENRILRRDTSSTYYLFLEVIRTFLLLIVSFYIINRKPSLIIMKYNVIEYWIIFVTARITEKWIIKFINGIIDFDNKLLSVCHLSLFHGAVEMKSLSKRFWNAIFAVYFTYKMGLIIIFVSLNNTKAYFIRMVFTFYFCTPEVIIFTVMITSFFYLYQLGCRFRTLNSLWKHLSCNLTTLPTVECTNYEITVLIECIRLLHAELLKLMRLFSLGYGPLLLVYFTFSFINTVCDMFFILMYNFYTFKYSALPIIFYIQHIILIGTILCVTSWIIQEKEKIISQLRLLRISKMPAEMKLQIKMFMDQTLICESNELTAFGFFNFNLKLFVSMLILLVTVITTLIQMKEHPVLTNIKEIFSKI